MDISNARFVIDDDLLDFTLDNDAEAPKTNSKTVSASPPSSSLTAAAAAEESCGSFPGLEEDLEWLSNKDAFPSVDTCFGILSENLELILDPLSPVSVLENSTTSNGGTTTGFLSVPGSFPVRSRSKNRRRKRTTGFGQMPSQQVRSSNRAGLGRRCSHCQADKTPQWRAGPLGPKTLCNACGVRYKAGRLVPEYRPVNSPTFSSVLHSNSHRKIMEMRRKKYSATAVGGAGNKVSEACGYSVG
ncbi:hypothetical protein ACS0TY_026121 [Phlomoides rotata]